MKVELQIELYKSRDTESNYFILTLFDGNKNKLVEGEYFTIFSEGTSHLEYALEVALEEKGFDPYEIRDLIEAGKINVLVDVEFNISAVLPSKDDITLKIISIIDSEQMTRYEKKIEVKKYLEEHISNDQ